MELNMNSDFSFSQTQEPYSIPFSLLLMDTDPLTIYDGSNDQSNQIAKLSGNFGSFSISSTGNYLLVTFQSDKYDDGSTGFLATIHYGNPYLNIK